VIFFFNASNKPSLEESDDWEELEVDELLVDDVDDVEVDIITMINNIN